MTDWYEDAQGVSRPVMHRLVIRDEELLREALEALRLPSYDACAGVPQFACLGQCSSCKARATITKLEERLLEE